jgi:hypothetical protein
MSDTNYRRKLDQYERRKAQFVRANPGHTPEQYQAFIRKLARELRI